MPGGVRWRWEDTPFSYEKLCYTVPLVVFAIVFVTDFFYEWLPESEWRLVLIGALGVAALLFVYKVVWRWMPERVRARVPYNTQEAQMQKGDVRTFWQFCRVLFGG